MATRASVGLSYHEDSAAAGSEAAASALTNLDGAQPALALVFATADHQHESLVRAIEAVVPGAAVVGCSGEGVIAQDESVEAFSAVAVMAVASDRIRFDSFLIDGYADDPAAAARTLAARVREHGTDARCLCLMPDGLSGNCTQFLEVLHAELDPLLPIVGGTAADAMTFDRTFQYGEGKVTSGGVAALLISGAVDVELAFSHGCSPIGLQRVITSADGGWVREIDGQPAWSLFKGYLDGDATDLNAEGIVHLCIGQPLPQEQAGSAEPYVVRTPMQLDQESGALFFPGGGLASGDQIQLTRRDPDKIRQSAELCAQRVLASRHGQHPALVLQFDCAGRGRIMFGACAAAEIVVPLRRVLGERTPWIGFHTYGEIAPIGGQPFYHNYTVALCAVYERPAA